MRRSEEHPLGHPFLGSWFQDSIQTTERHQKNQAESLQKTSQKMLKNVQKINSSLWRSIAEMLHWIYLQTYPKTLPCPLSHITLHRISRVKTEGDPAEDQRPPANWCLAVRKLPEFYSGEDTYSGPSELQDFLQCLSCTHTPFLASLAQMQLT